MKPKTGKAQGRPFDPYSSPVMDDSTGWVGPLPMKVVSVLDITEDVHRSGLRRGMHVLDLGCGIGDVSLLIAELVGPTGLVLGVDKSPESVDVAQKRSTVAGQCYWARFIAADPRSFTTHERFDVVVVRHALLLQPEVATFLRLSAFLHSDGVIIVVPGKSTGVPIQSVHGSDSLRS